MNKTILTLLLAVLAFAGAVAQPTSRRALSDKEREKYVTEIRQYKHQYLAEQLEMTEKQQKDFFPLYDQLDDKTLDLLEQSRMLEKKILDNPKVDASEMEATANTLYSTRLKEGLLEQEYYEKFRKILTAKQLVLLKGAERKFTHRLMKQQRQAREHHKK